MKKILFAAVATVALAASPAFADKVEKAGDGSITVGGKEYKVSNSRTKVTVAGAAGNRDSLKAGMDCTVEGPVGGEATVITCK